MCEYAYVNNNIMTMCVLVGHLIFIRKGEDKVGYPSQCLKIISSSSVLLFQLLVVLQPIIAKTL